MALALDEPRDDDQTFDLGDIPFVVAPPDLDALAPHALRIDYLKDSFGEGFQVYATHAAQCDTPW